MSEQLRAGVPLPLRQKYLAQMYPNLTKEVLEASVRSEQQRAIFCKYYGLGESPKSNALISEQLGLNAHSQIGVQLARVERKLKCDKDKRLAVLKNLRKEYYRNFRPKCPFCGHFRAEYRGYEDNLIKWTCGRCKRGYRTVQSEDSNRVRVVSISFCLDDSGEASELVVKVNGKSVEASGYLEMIVGDEDWNFKFGTNHNEQRS